jgi:hypothetical protein
MPQTCKRRPGGGGAAVNSLAGDGSHHSRVLPEPSALDARASDFAAAWFCVSPHMAAAVAWHAGLGGRGR